MCFFIEFMSFIWQCGSISKFRNVSCNYIYSHLIAFGWYKLNYNKKNTPVLSFYIEIKLMCPIVGHTWTYDSLFPRAVCCSLIFMSTWNLARLIPLFHQSVTPPLQWFRKLHWACSLPVDGAGRGGERGEKTAQREAHTHAVAENKGCMGRFVIGNTDGAWRGNTNDMDVRLSSSKRKRYVIR